MSFTSEFPFGTTPATPGASVPTVASIPGLDFVALQAVLSASIRLDREDTPEDERPVLPAPSWRVPGRPWRYGDPEHTGEHPVLVWEEVIAQAHVAGMITLQQAMRLSTLVGAWATALDAGSCKEPKLIELELELP